MHHVLHELHGGVFAAVPAVAGTLFFRERFGQYQLPPFHEFNALHSVLRLFEVRPKEN